MTKQPNDTAPDLIVLGLHEGQPRAARFPATQADLRLAQPRSRARRPRRAF